MSGPTSRRASARAVGPLLARDDRGRSRVAGRARRRSKALQIVRHVVLHAEIDAQVFAQVENQLEAQRVVPMPRLSIRVRAIPPASPVGYNILRS